ncbi:hypothetical protein JR316_0011222 [Psilocybe cubensis]|uniref:Uncharacterized protein n=2 Tax=Psilocybe cubensis TaxID=181762 RepID=A0A8H7XVU3_PSICU|nr:hypothetical protein JR316_0011222 [Psilocybe cubensis]KAH9475663.1 hypothetical protein JR316_0011222 [Psilocybe cubensis]
MPAHIPRSEYEGNLHPIVPKSVTRPDIVNHEHASDATRYLLPVLFTSHQGTQLVMRYPGFGVIHILEGEIQYEDMVTPGGPPTIMRAGSVAYFEPNSCVRWHCASASGAQGFGVFDVPVSVKSCDEFVVSN